MTEDGFGKIQFNLVAQISTAIDLWPAATATGATKYVAETSPKMSLKASAPLNPPPPACALRLASTPACPY